MEKSGLLSQLAQSPLNKTGWPWTEETSSHIYAELDFPKISIVTPSYNNGQYIEETIRSVLLQNYPNLEYIIIDGGSTDNTVNIIQKYEKWLTYWVSEEDEGQSHAINKGFIRCTGNLFNWLNSDDLLAPNSLFSIGKTFCYNQNALCICGKELRINNKKMIINTSKGSTILSTIEKTIAHAHIDQPSTFFKRDSVLDIFPLPIQLVYSMDTYLWINFLLKNEQQNVIAINNILVFFRYHQHSKTIKNGINFINEQKRIFDHLLLYLTNRSNTFMFQPINNNILIESLLEQVEKKINSYPKTKNEMYRKYSNYYLCIGLKNIALHTAFKAMKLKFSIVNFKNLFVILFKIIIPTLKK